MWHTPSGQRTLTGHEASLIRALAASVFEMLNLAFECDDGCHWRGGVTLFDALPVAQKITLLASVCDAMLRDDAPCPPLDAVHEAAVATLYETLRRDLEGEIDAAESYPDQDCTYLRCLALAAIRQVDGGDGELPDPESSDLNDWHVVADVLAAGVLWDDDWDMPDLVMDKDPETARLIKESLSISDDYYTAVPPEPSDKDIDAARALLRRVAADAP
jgi:hypothetical protein